VPGPRRQPHQPQIRVTALCCIWQEDVDRRPKEAAALRRRGACPAGAENDGCRRIPPNAVGKRTTVLDVSHAASQERITYLKVLDGTIFSQASQSEKWGMDQWMLSV